MWGPIHNAYPAGQRLQIARVNGEIVGALEQFIENAPTTYAQAFDERLGPFSTWEEAKAAVEVKVLERIAK